MIDTASGTATIQAVDEAESTIYILRRPGHEPVMAYWPQPLLEIAPDAVRIASWVEPDVRREGIVVSVAVEAPLDDFRSEWSVGLPGIRKRAERLRVWREQRHRRFLRTGRKHNKGARLSEEDIRTIQRRHYTGYESLRSICRELWQEKGYASANSMLNTLCSTLDSYGLRKRSQAEMTAHSNRMRSTRLEGEGKNEFKRRRRRELGQAHGRVCAATKTRYGKGRGERCQLAALNDSEFCRFHDPRHEESNRKILEHTRSHRSARADRTKGEKCLTSRC